MLPTDHDALARKQSNVGVDPMQDNCRRVLVVDDNPAMTYVIRFNLSRAGFSVSTARNGLEGWELIQRQQFHLVITDQQMPVMDGLEFCRRIRQINTYCSVPVIMLTAKGLELDLPRLTDELGITAVFPKPFSPSELVQAVENCVTSSV